MQWAPHIFHKKTAPDLVIRRSGAYSVETPAREMRETAGRVRLGRLFRDEDELPASTSLSDLILDALARSRFLIVICTPETRESRWVEREIQLFASLHGRDSILVALAEGERSECLPDILLYRKRVTNDGRVVSELTEPLAADYRKASRKSRRDENIRIVAAMLGCGFDDLRQRERARRNAFAAKLAVGVALATTGFLGTALWQQGRIIEQKQQIIEQQEQLLGKERELQANQSRYLAKEANELLQEGNRMQAVQVALAALPESSEGTDRPYVPEARVALERALQVFPTEDGWYPSFSREEGVVIDVATCDSRGEYAVLDSGGGLRAYDVEDGAVTVNADLSGVFGDICPGGAELWALGDGDFIVRQADSLFRIDLVQGGGAEVSWAYVGDSEGAYVHCADVSEDGSTIALCGASTRWTEGLGVDERASAILLDSGTGKVTHTFVLAQGKDVPHIDAVRLDPSGDRAFAASGGEAFLIDVESSGVSQVRLANPDLGGIFWLEDGIVVATQDYAESSPIPFAIQRIDATGKELWHVDGSLGTMAGGRVAYYGSADLWCMLRDFGDHGDRLVASLGDRLVTIRVEDGLSQAVATLDSPILACQVYDDGDCQRLNACAASGALVYMTSDEDGVSSGGAIDTDVGNVTDASFIRADGVTHLVASRASDEGDTSVVSVWRLLSTSRLRGGVDMGAGWVSPEDGPAADASIPCAIPGTEGATPVGRVPGANAAIVQSEGHLLLVDAETGDVLERSADTYEGAHGFGFTDDGRLFFTQVPIAHDHRGRSTLYVFDLSTGSLVPQSIIPFGVMISGDGTKVLVDDASTLRAPTWVMDYPTLDELLERGRDLCRGFELSPDEREALFVGEG